MEISSGSCFSLSGVTRPFVAYLGTRTPGPERVDPPIPALGVPYNSDRCLTLCAVAARLAGRRSAEEIGLQSQCRRDAAIAPPGRLSRDKYRLLLLAPRCGLRPLAVD